MKLLVFAATDSTGTHENSSDTKSLESTQPILKHFMVLLFYSALSDIF